jgi:glycosyltransferase involved in cell wall biosynthesis
MKIVLSAFSCGPTSGSENAVGWHWVQQISREHEVWLITTDEFRQQLEKVIPANVHASYIPSYQFWERLKLGVPGLDWLYYYWWQWKVWRVARKLHAEVGFDLAHHVTFVAWRAPSFLCLLPVPMIWGPVGGGGTIPRGLRCELGWKGRLFEGFRRFATLISRCDPFVRLTMRRAALIFAANRETASLVPLAYRSKVRAFLGIGISASEMAAATAPVEKPEGFVILFVALLRPLKGGTLALKALQQVVRAHPEALLVVIGSGSEGARMAHLAAELGIAERVRFLGGMPRQQVLSWMQAGDVLLHPSLRDSGGMVLLEAMGHGKPVVCLDLGGPGEIVDEHCGFKVTPGNPAQVVADLAAALGKLASSPSLRLTMGQAGRQRVRTHFDWNKRGKTMLEIYRQVLAGPAGTPRAP